MAFFVEDLDTDFVVPTLLQYPVSARVNDKLCWSEGRKHQIELSPFCHKAQTRVQYCVRYCNNIKSKGLNSRTFEQSSTLALVR